MRKLLAVVLALSFSAPAWSAPLGTQLELQASVGDAGRAMDGSAQLPSFASGSAAPSDDATPPEPPAKRSLLEKAKSAAESVHKFMVRNPVETSFAVSIPVTFVLGPTAGTIAGFVVYFLLSRGRKTPF